MSSPAFLRKIAIAQCDRVLVVPRVSMNHCASVPTLNFVEAT
ncbi:MAG: hypothetical protein AB4426_28760 [Xenococcaceae cyanobacterium]